MFSQLGLGESMDLSKRPSLQKLDSLLQEMCILVGQSRGFELDYLRIFRGLINGVTSCGLISTSFSGSGCAPRGVIV